ncbi:MAG: hypothetical protein Kow0096_08800 [Thiohalomonadaceae bacterium]
MTRALCFAFVTVFFVIYPDYSAAECSIEEKRIWNYDGTINGKYPIRLSLNRNGAEIYGVYFYHKYLKDIKLTGFMASEREIVLYEYDSNNAVVAEFQGVFLKEDPEGRFKSKNLRCELLSGKWMKKSSNSSFDFNLRIIGHSPGIIGRRYAVAGVYDDELVHRNAFEFWLAVKSDNKEKAAQYINYPIVVNYDRKDHTITNKSQFIENYDKIIPDWKKKAISESIPRSMSASWRGIMLGRGVVYFGKDGKVSKL